MNSNTLIVLALLFCFCLLTSCQDDPGVIMEKVSLASDSHSLGEATKMEGDAHSGNVFYRLESAVQFGVGYSLKVEDPYASKAYKIIIEGWARSNLPQTKGSIVITTNHNETMVRWIPIWLNNFIIEPNKWCYFKDSTLIPKAADGAGITTINVFNYLGEGYPEKFDLDDFKIIFKAE